MSGADTVQPQGDKIRKAIKWMSDMLQEHPDKNRKKLVRDAQIRFNLSPKESEFLESNFS